MNIIKPYSSGRVKKKTTQNINFQDPVSFETYLEVL